MRPGRLRVPGERRPRRRLAGVVPPAHDSHRPQAAGAPTGLTGRAGCGMLARHERNPHGHRPHAPGGPDRARARALPRAHPRSRALAEEARASLLGGVPMTWMAKWAGGFPLLLRRGARARGSPTSTATSTSTSRSATPARWPGHSPAATVARRRPAHRRARRHHARCCRPRTPTWVAGELRRRFGLPLWQFALTATDANRFALRLARQVTGRPKVLVFNYCYHGTVDETFAVLGDDGAGARGPATSARRSTPPRRRASSSSTTSRRWSASSRRRRRRAC